MRSAAKQGSGLTKEGLGTDCRMASIHSMNRARSFGSGAYLAIAFEVEKHSAIVTLCDALAILVVKMLKAVKGIVKS